MGQVINLPAYASFRFDDKKNPIQNGQSLQIDVNAPDMYEAYFSALRKLYVNGHSDFNDPETGKIRKEWKDALADLNSKEPSAYWCEVSYNCMKIDLQISCAAREDGVSAFALNIHIHDPNKSYRQASRPKGSRSPMLAIGRGPSGNGPGYEAKAHFKRLRGFVLA